MTIERIVEDDISPLKTGVVIPARFLKFDEDHRHQGRPIVVSTISGINYKGVVIPRRSDQPKRDRLANDIRDKIGKGIDTLDVRVHRLLGKTPLGPYIETVYVDDTRLISQDRQLPIEEAQKSFSSRKVYRAIVVGDDGKYPIVRFYDAEQTKLGRVCNISRVNENESFFNFLYEINSKIIRRARHGSYIFLRFVRQYGPTYFLEPVIWLRDNDEAIKDGKILTTHLKKKTVFNLLVLFDENGVGVGYVPIAPNRLRRVHLLDGLGMVGHVVNAVIYSIYYDIFICVPIFQNIY